MGLFGGESKFESSIKQVPYPQEAVYRNISDLSNLEKVRDRIPEDKINDFSFDEDTVTLNVQPVGELKLRICDREEPKCVKFETVQSPVPFNVWIQVELEDEGDGEGRTQSVHQEHGGEAASGGRREDRRCLGASAVYLSEE